MVHGNVLEKSPAASALAAAPCAACGRQVAAVEPLCQACGRVQPVRALDHFARLGLATGFTLVPGDLDRAYFARQRQVHPDRFARKSPAERDLSMQQTAALNEAYETLRQPLRRAGYLLRLAGVAVPGDGHDSTSDPAVLMEAMERREALSEAADDAAIQTLIGSAAEAAVAAEASLERHFAAGDMTAAAAVVLRLTYLARFLAEAKGRRAALAGG